MQITRKFPPVNSGALCCLRTSGNTIKVYILQPSASSHVSPHYKFSKEAPRVYGPVYNDIIIWYRWMCSLLNENIYDDSGSPLNYSALRIAILSHFSEIPKI